MFKRNSLKRHISIILASLTIVFSMTQAKANESNFLTDVPDTEDAIRLSNPKEVGAIREDNLHALLFRTLPGTLSNAFNPKKGDIVRFASGEKENLQVAGTSRRGSFERVDFTVSFSPSRAMAGNDQIDAGRLVPTDIPLEYVQLDYMIADDNFVPATVTYSFREGTILDGALVLPRGATAVDVLWQTEDGEEGSKRVDLSGTFRGWVPRNGGWQFYDFTRQTEPIENEMVVVDGITYYAGQGGWRLHNNWKRLGNRWYYFGTLGQRIENDWIKENGIWYYLGKEGVMKTGWVPYKGYWYYLNASGDMKTNGWQWFRGKCYYLQADGSMARNKWIGSDYVDDTGAWVKK